MSYKDVEDGQKFDAEAFHVQSMMGKYLCCSWSSQGYPIGYPVYHYYIIHVLSSLWMSNNSG
jgi:hypothetical protein